MSLITLFICLAIIKLTQFHSNFNLAKLWPNRCLQWLQGVQLPNAWIMIALLLVPVLLVVELVYGGLTNAGGGYQLLGLILSGVILWLCLGPYVLTPGDETVSAGSFFKRINQRLFALLFWFIILGPIGAVLYRGSLDLQQLSDDDENPLASARDHLAQLIDLLDYIPIRLTILIYALAGDFSHCFGFWLGHFLGKPSSNTSFLLKGSLIAVGLDSDNESQSLSTEAQTNAIRIIERGLAITLIIVLIFMFGGLIL